MVSKEEPQAQPDSIVVWDYLFSLSRNTATRNWAESLRTWFNPRENLIIIFEERKREIPLDLNRADELRKLETSVNLRLMEIDLAYAIVTLSSETERLLRISSMYTTISFLLVFYLYLANQPKHYYLIVLSLNLLVVSGIHLLLRWRYLSEKEALEYYKYLVKLAQIQME